MKSDIIIESAKKRFKELERYDYDWGSFYNGFLEGAIMAISTNGFQDVPEAGFGNNKGRANVNFRRMGLRYDHSGCRFCSKDRIRSCI
jgi:hypothetical protein